MKKGQDTMTKSVPTKSRRRTVASSARKPDRVVVRRALFQLLKGWDNATSLVRAQEYRVCVDALLRVADEVEALVETRKVDTWAMFMSRYYRLLDKWDRDIELSCFGGPNQGEKCGTCPASRACLYEYRKGRAT